jgi:hypothetical protein
LQTLQQRLFKTHQLKRVAQKGGVYLSKYFVNASELLYRPGNAFLIETFDITPQEQTSLKTLIGPEEKMRRADAKAPGRAERRQQRAALKERVQAWLQAHGGICQNVSALARELNEAVGRVWRTVQACLREMGLVSNQISNQASNQVSNRKAGAMQSVVQSEALSVAGWSVPAHLFIGFGKTKRRKTIHGSTTSPGSTYHKPRSILGSYGRRHEESLAALRQATARPKSAGFKHWMPDFVRDVTDHYRRHAQWPSAEQRQALMAWHQQAFAARLSVKSGRATPKMAPKPVFSTDVTHNLSSKSSYLSTKDFFVQHYGEEGCERWESMTAVQRLHASIQMEQEIWSRANNEAKQASQSFKEGIRQRWQRMVGKDQERIATARQAELTQRRNLMTHVVGNLRQAWGAKNQPSPQLPVLVACT